MTNTEIKQKLKRDCLYAALMGDALGVPHEFKTPGRINVEYIKNPQLITKDYKTYPVDIGLISDDGSQILMVENIIDNPTLVMPNELISWMSGKYWTNNTLFDIGQQTRTAIASLRDTGKIYNDPNGSGNGSLMRTLPVAFMDNNNTKFFAHNFSSFTHNSEESQKACEFYCLLVRKLWELRAAYPSKKIEKHTFVSTWMRTEYEMNWYIRPDQTGRPEIIKGTGYVMDSLKLVYRIIYRSLCFTDCILNSICHGFDTDTNTSIVAPVAALMFGMDDVPQSWHDMMKVNDSNPYYVKYAQLVKE